MLPGKTILCSLLICVLLLCACTSSPPISSDTENTSLPAPNVNEPTTVRLLAYSGNGYAYTQTRADDITEAVNAKLAENGHPVRLFMDVKPYEDMHWMNVYGAPFTDEAKAYDLFFEHCSRLTQLQSLVALGDVCDLTDYHLSNKALADVTPENAWREVAVDGRIYAFPLVNHIASEGVWDSGILIRSDIIRELGIAMPESPEELLEAAKMAKERGLDYQLAYDQRMPPYAFHRTYEEWPFFVDTQSLFLMTSDGMKLNSYPHSDIFVKDATLLRAFYEERLLRLLRWDQVGEDEAKWDFLASLNPIVYQAETPHREDIEVVQFAPERENFRMTRYADFNLFVSSKASDPAAAMALISAIYTDQDVYDAFIYGVEGTDWKLHDDGAAEILKATENYLTHDVRHRKYFGATRTSIYELPAREGTVISVPGVSFSYAMDEQGAGTKLPPLLHWEGSRQTLSAVRSGLLNSPLDIALPSLLQALDGAGYQEMLSDAQKMYSEFMTEVEVAK